MPGCAPVTVKSAATTALGVDGLFRTNTVVVAPGSTTRPAATGDASPSTAAARAAAISANVSVTPSTTTLYVRTTAG